MYLFSPLPLGSIRNSKTACVKWEIYSGDLGYHSLTSTILKLFFMLSDSPISIIFVIKQTIITWDGWTNILGFCFGSLINTMDYVYERQTTHCEAHTQKDLNIYLLIDWNIFNIAIYLPQTSALNPQPHTNTTDK